MVFDDVSKRKNMIDDIAATLICHKIPTNVYDGALDLIGWLARRMPGEEAIERAARQQLLFGDGLP